MNLRLLIASAYFFTLVVACTNCTHAGNTRFAVLITSYNNQEYCWWNIESALNQQYDNFYIIYVNDCSTDRTGQLVDCIKKNYVDHNLTVFHNDQKQGAMANQYNTIHRYIYDDDVVVILDGDDAFAHSYVLRYLDEIYCSEKSKTWMTYGQYQTLRWGKRGIAESYTLDIVNKKQFRKTPFIASHLRTFKAWLFKNIKKEDLMMNGSFIDNFVDGAAMFPMLEMASPNHFLYIPEILVMYNDRNPLNCYKVYDHDAKAQNVSHIQCLPVYKSIDAI